MLRNDNNIIKNGDKIFTSQVVDSYLRHNDDGISRLYMTATGLTTTDPLYIYYGTPTYTIKCTMTTNSSVSNVCFPATNETSYKKFYFCGNVEGVTSFQPILGTYPYNGYFTGDMICIMGEFPQLQTADFCQGNREVDFNQNITDASFPETLRTFKICDRGIAGDLTTVKNFEKLECIELQYTPLTGKISDIRYENLKELTFDYTNSTVVVDVNDIIDNNPSLYRFDTYAAYSQCLNGTTLDPSQLTYFNAYWAGGGSNISGNISGWTFNTGLTYFNIYVSTGLNGDLSNWDISNTNLTHFYFNNYGYGGNPISGDIFSDGYPSTLQRLCLFGTEHITGINGDFSNASGIQSICGYRTCALSGDVTTWNIPSGITSFGFYQSHLSGDLTQLCMPLLTSVNMTDSCFTGNITGITLGSGASSINLYGNYLCGELTDYPYEPATYLRVGDNSGITLNLSSTYAPNISNLYFENISGITGNWENLDTTNITRLVLDRNTNITAINFDKLDVSTLSYLFFNEINLSGDFTGIFTGTTTLISVSMTNSPNFSADTSNWNLGGIQTFLAYYTPIYGTLCNDNVYQLRVQGTCISSNIETDFSFSGRSYWVELSNTCITGHLSGVTIHPNTYQFIVGSNSSLYGSNEFSDYLFVNRKNWTRNYSSVSFSNIGDTPTGTYQQGDLGTYGGDPWDLSEVQINNLAVGSDYDGGGSNVPWTSKEKVWWNECARCPGGTVLRYCVMNIVY